MEKKREVWYSGSTVKVKNLRNWMILSFVWSTVFTIYFFSIATMLWGWVGLVIGHLGIIFAMYYTFKQFHNKPYTIKPDPNDPPLYDDVWYGS
jgi:1,4-dihydroxy-2-naphthoate octaprenyltransferase